MSSQDFSALQKQLPYLLRPGEVRRTKRGGFEATCLPYLDRTIIETALDVAVGVDGWQTVVTPFSEDGAVRCALGLLSDGAWLWRQDVGYPEGEERPAASAATNAFKRAAARWGIGRFLQELPRPWLPCKVLLQKDADSKARIPVFRSWDCDPEEEMERRIAGSRRGGADRIFEAMAEHLVPPVEVARWCLSNGYRDVRDLPANLRGQLESLIVSGHFKGGANGSAAQA